MAVSRSSACGLRSSGMERFFEQHAELPEGEVDPEAYRRVARENWMEVVGPPLSVSDPG